MLLCLLFLAHQGLAFNTFEALHTTRSVIKEESVIIEETDTSKVVTRQIEQPLDHFSDECRRWNMTYYERLDLFKPGGPLLILLSTENMHPDPAFIASDRVIFTHIANATNGALFNTDRRYNRGCDIPNSKMMVFKYHTSDQAMADVIKLVKHLKSDPRFKDSKVVVMGVELAGTLAVWLRLKYPDLIDAAYASGAPTLAKHEFPEYYEALGEELKQKGPPGCYDAVEKLFKQLEDSVKTKEGRARLREDCSLCNRTYALLDDSTVHENFFSSQAQYHSGHIIKWGAAEYCKRIFNLTKDGKSCLAKNEDTCYEYDLIYFMEWFLRPLVVTRRAKFYPYCKEFGYTPVSSKKQPFGQKVFTTSVELICFDMFTIDSLGIVRNVNATNRKYGGLTPNVTRALFVSGSRDPMRSVIVTKSLRDSPALVIKDALPYSEVALTDHDSNETIEARKVIVETIKTWLGIK